MAENTAETDAVKAAILMADLSRKRQDDLPLSRRANKGPTYAPTKTNGTDHIPNQQKVALQSAWGNPIKDEESELVEGLDIKDCPWRPKKGVMRIKALLQSNMPSAPSQPRRPSEMRNNTCMLSMVHRPTPAPSPSNSGNDKIPTRQMAKLSIQDASETRKQVLPVAVKTRAQVTAAQTGTVGTDPPKQSSKPPSLERCDIHTCELKFIDSRCIPYRGEIMIYPWPDRSSPFIASFHVELCLRGPEGGRAYALLHLTAEGLPPRKHDISHLDNAKPESDNRFCILKGQEDGVRFAYRIELKTPEKTGLFVESIWGVKLLIESSTAAPQQSTTPSIPAVEAEAVPALVDAEAGALIKVAGEEELVDFAPEPPVDTSTIMGAITTEAVTAICELTTSVNVDSDLQNIMKGIYDGWELRLRLSRSPGLQETLKDLIQTLFRLDVFVGQALASGSLLTSPIPESIKDLLKPIKYSASELLKMRDRAIECPDALKGVRIPKHVPFPTTPSALTGLRHASTPNGTSGNDKSPSMNATTQFQASGASRNTPSSSGRTVSKPSHVNGIGSQNGISHAVQGSDAISAGAPSLNGTPAPSRLGFLTQNASVGQAAPPAHKGHAALDRSAMQHGFAVQTSQRSQAASHESDTRSGLFAYSDVPENNTPPASDQVTSNSANSRIVSDKNRKKPIKGLSSSMFAN